MLLTKANVEIQLRQKVVLPEQDVQLLLHFSQTELTTA